MAGRLSGLLLNGVRPHAVLWAGSQPAGLDDLVIDLPIGCRSRQGSFGRIALERGAAINGSVAADEGVLDRVALDIVGLDRAASLCLLLGKSPGRFRVAVHLIGLVGGHALFHRPRLTVGRHREFPLACRHPVRGPQARRCGKY